MRRRFTQFAWFVLGVNLIVVLWGAVVRATKSGEGCGDHWPLCNGSVIPHAAAIGTLIEFAHRVSVPVASAAVMIMLAWAFLKYRREPVWKAAAAAFVLLIFEAALGAGLVLFKYTGTDVSIGRIAYLSAHSANTQLLLGALALTAWWAAGPRAIDWARPAANPFKISLAAALAAGITGAITALSDTVYPVTSLNMGFAADFSSASPVVVRLRILHPILALATAAYIAILATRTRKAPRLRSAVIALVVLQIAAGAVNLYLLTPVWMQIVHLLIGDLLWLALVLFAAESLERASEHGPAARLAGLSAESAAPPEEAPEHRRRSSRPTHILRTLI